MWKTGTVLRSLAGRDKGYLLCAFGGEEDFALVCDGKERPLQRPKRKNRKHLVALEDVMPLEPEALRGNRALRRRLRQIEEERLMQGAEI
ncbi:MAG: KOW domain-containing RNA-binding protein [Oscillospiraceae bacterium]|jgi:ribosomal protein L14E/L6E/L27E|nr:KOW domain-containing RNA-binding protein [Oscillospiraceae bacterium]